MLYHRIDFTDHLCCFYSSCRHIYRKVGRNKRKIPSSLSNIVFLTVNSTPLFYPMRSGTKDSFWSVSKPTGLVAAVRPTRQTIGTGYVVMAYHGRVQSFESTYIAR